MPRLLVNGKTVAFEEPCTLEQALRTLGHRGRTFAVAVDGAFVSRDRYATFRLDGGESLEVLSPMQGG